MKISNSLPPNYEEVKRKFGIGIHVCFAYGDTIYNPSGDKLEFHVIKHEETHSKQQKGDVEGWWRKYLDDPSFRFSQEIEAYQTQYKSIKSVFNRSYRRLWLDKLAHDLSGKMYGNLCTLKEAKEIIE